MFKTFLYKEWLVGFILFTLSNPYFFWHTPFSLFIKVVLLFVVCFNFEIKTGKEGIGLACLFLFYILVALRHNGSIWGALFILIIPLYLLIKSDLIVSGFEKFTKILSVVTIFSLLSYLLITFGGLKLPCSVITPLNPLKDFDYLAYPFLIMEDRNIGLLITRFYCVFDEPGVYGCMAAVILCKEHFNFRKWELIPIFLGGIFTFSLYFYMVCLFYLFLFASLKIKISFIVIVLLLLPSLLLIDDLRILLFNRFIIADGEWRGNSRYGTTFARWYDDFRNTSDYWFGMGSGYNLVVNNGGASYKDIIVNYGVIMFVLYIVSYMVLALRKNLKEFILTIFLIISFVFQRPFIFDLSIIYLFVYCYHKQYFPKAIDLKV